MDALGMGQPQPRPVQAPQANGMRQQTRREEKLHLSELLDAMGKCVEYYDKADKIEFYGVVAEAYDELLPMFEGVSLSAIEKYELMMRAIAHTLTTGEGQVDIQPEFVKHLPDILAFYRQVGGAQVEVHDPTPTSQRDAPLSVEQADDEPVYKREDPSEGLPQESSVAFATASDPTAQTPQAVVSTVAAPTTAPIQVRFDPLNPVETIEMIRVLTEARADAERRYHAKEAILKLEDESVERAKQKYKSLKAVVKNHRKLRKERLRIDHLMDREGSDDGVGLTSSLDEDRRALRKEQKRLKRLQDDIMLKYKLLESENLRLKMEVENQMRDLRSEYLGTIVFDGAALQ